MNEEVEIGQGASPANPIMSGVVTHTITLGADSFKEGLEVFAVGLLSTDQCVCLGRDQSFLLIPENGGMHLQYYYTFM